MLILELLPEITIKELQDQIVLALLRAEIITIIHHQIIPDQVETAETTVHLQIVLKTDHRNLQISQAQIQVQEVAETAMVASIAVEVLTEVEVSTVVLVQELDLEVEVLAEVQVEAVDREAVETLAAVLQDDK